MTKEPTVQPQIFDYYNFYVIQNYVFNEPVAVIENSYTYEENGVLYCASATEKGVYCYSYCLNNPLMYTDPSGQSYSPYFDRNGNHLGNDENGWSGKIYITDESTFNNYKTGDNLCSSSILNDINKPKKISEIAISDFAIGKMVTAILGATGYINTNDLYNGSISIYSGSRGGVAYGFNDPLFLSGARGKAEANFRNSGKINVTMNAGSRTEWDTVESLQSFLGIHEFKGHGKLGYDGDGRTAGGQHYKSYQLQFDDKKTFNKLSDEHKREIVTKTINFMYHENRNAYNYHQQNNTWLYQNYKKYMGW